MAEMEWIEWEEQEPVQGEAMLVIFYNHISGMYHRQIGSVIHGPFWYDYTPVRWMPFPPLPDDLAEKNNATAKRCRGEAG